MCNNISKFSINISINVRVFTKLFVQLKAETDTNFLLEILRGYRFSVCIFR